MININELRIGNWIRKIQSETGTRIGYDMQITAENFQQIISNPEEYKPTPMSWEFVENTIAVEDFDDDSEDDDSEDIGFRSWDYPISERDSIMFSTSESGTWTMLTGDNDIVFENVHTFQNFVFAWTGGLEIEYK